MQLIQYSNIMGAKKPRTEKLFSEDGALLCELASGGAELTCEDAALVLDYLSESDGTKRRAVPILTRDSITGTEK